MLSVFVYAKSRLLYNKIELNYIIIMNSIKYNFQPSEFNMANLRNLWYDTTERVLKKVYQIRGFLVYESDGEIINIVKL